MANSSFLAALAATYDWEISENSGGNYFSFEDIDVIFWIDMARRTRFIAYSILILYIVGIFYLRRWMKHRTAYELKIPLALWNLTLGVGSIIGFLRMLPSFLNVLNSDNGFYNSICVRKHLDIPMSFWGLWFTISKFWELGDTVFIVLRKRPLMFIQYYHHLVTAVGAWMIAPMLEPVGRWVPVLNLGVHSFMYNYFALRAFGVRVPTLVANFITTIQLLQLVIIGIVNMMSTVYFFQGNDCYRDPFSVKFMMVSHVTFFSLFAKLFYDSVIKQGREKRSMSEKTKKID